MTAWAGVSKLALKRDLLAAADDKAAGALRREVVHAVAAGLEKDGQRLDFIIGSVDLLPVMGLRSQCGWLVSYVGALLLRSMPA